MLLQVVKTFFASLPYKEKLDAAGTKVI